MNRRELVGGMGAWLGTALAGVAVTGCPTRNGAVLEVPYDEVPALVASLRDRAAAIRAAPLPPDVAAAADRAGLPEGTVQDLLAGLLVAGTFRDLDRGAQRHPELQALVVSELPRWGRGSLAVARWLRRLDRDERAALTAALVGDGDLLGQVRRELRAGGASRGVDEVRLAQVDEVLGQVSWSLRRQPPAVLLDELDKAVVAVATAEGLPADAWDGAIATELPHDPAAIAAALTDLLLAEPEGAPPRATADAAEEPPVRRSARLSRVGAKLVGYGLGLPTGALLVGALLSQVSESAGALFLVVGVFGGTVGVICALVGVGFLVAAANARAHEREPPPPDPYEELQQPEGVPE